MTNLMLVMTAILLLATGVILLVAIRLVRALRHTVELEQRVVRLQEGINLLTDTTETGFRELASEIERRSASVANLPAAAAGTAAHPSVTAPVPAAPAPGPAAPSIQPSPTAARLWAAAWAGRSIKEIAAAEQVSESEVRLFLSLTASNVKEACHTIETDRASLCS